MNHGEPQAPYGKVISLAEFRRRAQVKALSEPIESVSADDPLWQRLASIARGLEPLDLK